MLKESLMFENELITNVTTHEGSKRLKNRNMKIYTIIKKLGDEDVFSFKFLNYACKVGME